ncbi:MAG: hypothetical protein HY303_05280 [Candidatus Wallbacteria bacterium]|nr:hypothetical protein [Candidatus Wallbacteria bacterium]
MTARWRSKAARVALAALAAPGLLLACDPNHSWSVASELRRPALSPRAVGALTAQLVSRLGKGLSSSPRVALLEAVDQTPKRTGPATAEFLDAFETGLRSAAGASLIRPEAVARRLSEEKRPAGAIYDTRFFASLARRDKAELFVKVRLVMYDSELRQLRDLAPANRGLEATQLLDVVRARVSVQAADGSYRFIDELEGTAVESFLYFADSGRPSRLVEVYLERPGGKPFEWKSQPDHKHFEF